MILTQKVDINDDILGFFHSWLFEFSKKCEAIITICLEKGQYDLPENVKILSLGKEEKKSRIIYLFRFFKYIWQERKNYDAVFVHMNPIYVVLGGLFWRLSGKKIILWYTHRQVDAKLRLAEKFVNLILTVSRGSFCLPSKKLKILGHGIDADKFRPIEESRGEEKFRVAYVGRIAEIKNQKILVRAVDYLVNEKNVNDIQVCFVGNPIYREDEKLLKEMKNLINEKKLENYINFAGSVSNKDIFKIYQQADLTINLCPAGGLDKVVLESMACGVPAIVFNKNFEETFEDYQNELILEKLDEKELGNKILDVKNWDWGKRKLISRGLREIIIQKHSLNKLISKIINYFNS